MPVPYKPQGYHAVTPYLIVDGADAALAFYREAFDAEEIFRLPMGHKVGHAEFRIGDSFIMLSDEWPELDQTGPHARGGTTVSLMVYVPDVDAAVDQAANAGASIEREPQDQPWGDRTGTVIDPFGHRWTLATHLEDVPVEEIRRRLALGEE
ncbi:VOC family protein [Pseudoxanthomonas composti]|uniref:VOC family protein n=2 Tax=Pseudoxanthomonas composti TaxID=2137479 RepID=A0A4Q1JW44_9GAMM|nr:VOC family protein [Pseudoxanthomonas composti]